MERTGPAQDGVAGGGGRCGISVVFTVDHEHFFVGQVLAVTVWTSGKNARPKIMEVDLEGIRLFGSTGLTALAPLPGEPPAKGGRPGLP